MAITVSNLVRQAVEPALNAVGGDVKALLAYLGDLGALQTTATTVPGAINEIKAAVDAAAQSGGAAIDDAAVTTSTVWSSSKIDAEIVSQIADVVGAAPAAFDTLVEIATALEAEETATANILAALANRVRTDAAQSLTDPQIAQVRANLQYGDFAAAGVALAGNYTTARDS